MSDINQSYPEYPFFKGLQRPLEFMGLQGRYIWWAAGIVAGGLFGFILCYVSFGFLVALGFLTVILGLGGALVFIKQRRGLYSKHCDKGVFVFFHSLVGFS